MVKKRTIKIVMFYLFCLFPNSHLISLFKISSLTFRLFFHYKLNRPFLLMFIYPSLRCRNEPANRPSKEKSCQQQQASHPHTGKTADSHRR